MRARLARRRSGCSSQCPDIDFGRRRMFRRSQRCRISVSDPMRCAMVAFALCGFATPAAAYRPFDGTDAAVAKKGEMEIELQPAGRLRDESGTSLIAPAWVVNYGLSEGWEAVFEGQGQTSLSPPGPTTLTAAGAFLKHVVVPGSLQDKTGPSVATEFGVLLPDSTGASGVGASFAAIVSERWDWGTIHLNAETALTRDHHADVFVGAILEGPSTWTVRPVAEIFYENDFGKMATISGLAGLIYRVNDDLSFDIGIRHALTNGHPVNEIRAGLTFGFPLSLLEAHGSHRERSSDLPR
ncbi:hypothetical protein [Bradyrhizobium sp. CCBAU 53340]|uniref:hypothetical protein n=2 Tax=Bradyrhizobium TaxID=374 RepID=UPI001FEF7115|nr:hypothetical protein [Bradyrhizobium sp. CCBAU 53340]